MKLNQTYGNTKTLTKLWEATPFLGSNLIPPKYNNNNVAEEDEKNH